MKKVVKNASVTTLALIALAVSACTLSCSKNDKNPATGSGQHFTIAAWGEGETQYVAAVPSLVNGSLTFKGNGLEAQGSRYLWHKQYVYLMNLPEKKFIQYEMKADGSVKEKAYILTDGVLPNYFQSLNVIDDNNLLVLGAAAGNKGVAGWARISVNDFRVMEKGTLTVPFDASQPDVEFSIGKGFVDNGKFILGGYTYDNKAGAYVAQSVRALVYDYPAMNNMKVIETTVTGGGYRV